MADEEGSYYSFLPWVRQGIGAEIKQEDTLGISGASSVPERPGVKVLLTVEGAPEVVEKSVSLYGPGDVIGIDRRAVVRVEPPNWVTDFEPNYVASIDFYDEDLPWRFTPTKATDDSSRLRPWICLIVLAEGEFTDLPFSPDPADPNRPLPAIQLVGDPPLPPPAQTWAWAHVHVNDDLAAPDSGHPGETPIDKLRRKLAGNPDLAFSRLICPRRLQPKTAYHAFVIPTFEVGRLAGLGEPTMSVDGLKPAWGESDIDQTKFPVYYRWYFRTGDMGDFEYQVKLLQPRELDRTVGTRLIDCQEPAPTLGIRGVSGAEPLLGALGLEGALTAGNCPSSVWPPDPGTDPNEPAPLQVDLAVHLNQSYELQQTTGAGPAVTAPIYGCWHAGARSVGNDVARPWSEHWKERWLDELNLDPRWRVAAGLGAQIVQQNQEKYMEAAWRQVGQIKAINRQLKHAQLAREVSGVYYKRDLEKLEPDVQLWITRSVHSRVLNEGASATVWQGLRDSVLDQGALDWGFRQLVRPRGPLMRRLAGNQSAAAYPFLAKIDAAQIWAAAEKKPAESMFTVARIAAKLKEEQQKAVLAVLAEDQITPEQVRDAKPPHDFQVNLPEQQNVAIGQEGKFQSALIDAHTRLQAEIPAPASPARNVLSDAAEQMQVALDPEKTIQKKIQTNCAGLAEYQAGAQDPLAPVMACPDFPEPMYKALRDLSLDLLSPNLGLIPPNTVAMLVTNRRFIEAYMVGLNHEMNRELLWREYPTDQRGTCFRQFWEAIDPVNADTAAQQKDIAPISEWDTSSALGNHDSRVPLRLEYLFNLSVVHADLLNMRVIPTLLSERFQLIGIELTLAWVRVEQAGTRWTIFDGDKRYFIRKESSTLNVYRPTAEGQDRIVLVIRGDFLKKFPLAAINARPAKMDGGARTCDWNGAALEPIFQAKIGTDITFLGFDLTETVAIGDRNDPNNLGWFIVFQERAGELRFGLDEASGPATENPNKWADLSWGHLATAQDAFDSFGYVDLNHRPQWTNEDGKPVDIDTSNFQGQDRNIQWDELNSHSADMAYIFYQKPVAVAIHAAKLLG
jgi:hypothetical protein